MDILVLCYHAVSDDWPVDLSVNRSQFESQVHHLLDRGYAPATFSEAIMAPPTDKVVAITFDDAYRSVHRLAFPILSSLGVPATVFAPTDWVGREEPMSWPGIDHWAGTEHEQELVCMDWDELRELRSAGWEIGSHTCSHPRLTRLEPDELRRELRASREALESAMGEPCRSIAYPYGDVDRRVAAFVAQAGYATACTLGEEPSILPLPLLWPRQGVYHDDSFAHFRRHMSPAFRRLQASPAWGTVRRVVPIVRAGQERLRTTRSGTGGEPHAPSPALRLAATRGRVVTDRRAVLAAGALGRAGLLEAWTLWPDAQSPLFIVGAGDRAAAAWMQRTFEPRARAVAGLDPAGWNVARAGALLVGHLDGPAIEAAERTLGRALPGARLAAFSPTGAPRTKVTFFVFEAGADEPTVVVKAMPEPNHAERLLHECEAVERVRERLAPVPDVQAALPLPPLGGTWSGPDYLVVQAVDPLAAYTGRAPRAVALDWLRRFQAATAEREEPWERRDDVAELAALEFGWRTARPESAQPVAERVQALLAELRGVPVPRSAVHGDYWRGNLASDLTRLRVFDWEWTRPLGPPFQDVWTYELGELREQAMAVPAEELDEAMQLALERVEQQLAEYGLDPRFALATLAPAIAELSFRVRRETGRPGGNELGAALVMESVEELLGLPRRR